MSQAGSFATGGGGGGGITTINVDHSGSVTGSTIDLFANSGSASNGATVFFNAVSATEIDLALTSTQLNMFIGPSSGVPDASIPGGGPNLGLGNFTLSSLTGIGTSDNVAIGYGAGYAITTGQANTAIGVQSLNNAFTPGLTGSFNIAIGFLSGSSYTGAESNNTLINSNGLLGESSVIRISDTTSSQPATTCFIGGIDGVTVVGSAVLCSVTGQLGDIASSIKFKENVEDISKTSHSILDCRPVSFHYKSDKAKTKSFGMIAEEVEKVFPDLVLYKDGVPYSLKYHEMPALLLAEIQKLKAEVSDLRKLIT